MEINIVWKYKKLSWICLDLSTSADEDIQYQQEFLQKSIADFLNQYNIEMSPRPLWLSHKNRQDERNNGIEKFVPEKLSRETFKDSAAVILSKASTITNVVGALSFLSSFHQVLD